MHPMGGVHVHFLYLNVAMRADRTGSPRPACVDNVHTCTCRCTCRCTRACTRVHACACTHTHVHVCTCACAHACMRAHLCVPTQVGCLRATGPRRQGLGPFSNRLLCGAWALVNDSCVLDSALHLGSRVDLWYGEPPRIGHYLLNYYLLTYLLICVRTYLRTYVLAYLRTCVLAYLLACLLTYLLT